MGDQCTYGNNSISFNEWKIEEDDVNNHLHLYHNGNQICQFTENGLDSKDVIYDNTTSELTSTNIQDALDEEEKHIQNSSGQNAGGGHVKFVYRYESNTSDNNPGTGKVRLNNSTLSSVTEMFINNSEKLNSVNVRNILLLGQDSELYIYIQKAKDASRFALYSCNTIVTSESDYLKFTGMTYEQGNSSLSSGKDCLVIFAKKVGTQIKGINIPNLPTTSGNSYKLVYEVDSNSFQWVLNV